MKKHYRAFALSFFFIFLILLSFAFASPPSDGSPCTAGPDQVICSSSTQLQGSGLQGKAVWTVLSAPAGGTVAFADSLDPKTTVSFSKKGTYLLRWGGAYGGDLVCYDQVSITWASPQAEICEHALACEDEQASFDLTVTSGNNAGLYALRILDEQDGQVQLLTNLPYGQKKKIDFPYQSEHQYRLVLYEKDGAPLCLQNPYPLSFAEPAVTIQTDAAEKIVCASGSASFTVQASLSSSACKQPSWEAFSYYLFSKPDNALLASWPNTEGPIQTDPLPLGSYVLRASPKAWGYTACYGQTELLVLPSSLKAEVKIQNPSCHGSGDGSAEALVTGGEKYLEGTAYRCAWFRAEDAQKTDTLSALSSVSGLEAGNYVLEVRDAGACAEPPLQVYFSLSDAFPLEAPLLKASACGAEALLFPAGGEAPYTFAFEAKTENGYKLLAAVQGQEQNNGVTAQAGLPLPALVRVTVTDGRGCSVSSQDTYLEAPALTSSYNLCFRWRTAPKSAPAAVEPAFVSLPSLEADRMKQTLAEQQSTCLTNTEQALFALQESSCLALTSLEDETALSFERGEELHTLFYGDRAGRLLSSLPPEGVKPLAGNELSRANHPAHTRKSLYAYDESGAVLESTSPNGGTTRFRYNRLGQLRFSQDGVQQEKNTASFVVYDALSRPVRSGTAALNKDYFDPYQNKLYAIQSFEDLTALLEADEASFTALPAEARYPDAAQSTAEVTKTVYGTPQDVAYPVTGQGQTHLRGRVSMISRQNGQEEEAKHVKSYFAYDVHGNVAWTLTKRHDLSDQYTRSEYDLITGKVNKSVSNENSASALWQRFAYDEDGRLLASESSRDGVLFEPDARYAFYKHGPLKRIVLGADAVQGIDLTATLQGLIKGINHPTADPSADGENNTVGADAFASVLSYRTNDFVHQATPFTAKDPLTLLEQNHAKGGLVGGWVSKEGYGGSGTVYDQTHGRTFVYDKAGRLKQSNTKLYNEQTKVFANTEDYKESFAYDRNGNLTSLTRNAHGLEGKNRAQDKLSYYYTENTDRLRHIKDAVGAANWSGDLDDQGEDNYAYDQAGRLIKDKAEGIEQIDWTSDDKVARVLKADKTEIRFRYGTGGERIEKSVIPQGKQTEAKSTLYASGMVLERKREVVNDKTYDEVLILKEQSLAEGLLTRERELQRIRYEEGKAPKPIVTLSIPEAYASAERGAKTYALKDHLGSVRVSVSDTKLSDMQDDKPSNFKAEVLSIARYDAFGSPQQGRQYASKNYRYGYNGMEKDEELKGSGNSYDYGARFYDPRAARWLSVDPKAGAFPAHSPYHFAFNNPVAFNDPDGQAPREKLTAEKVNLEFSNGYRLSLTHGELEAMFEALYTKTNSGNLDIFTQDQEVASSPTDINTIITAGALIAAVATRNPQLMRALSLPQRRGAPLAVPVRRYAMPGPGGRRGGSGRRHTKQEKYEQLFDKNKDYIYNPGGSKSGPHGPNDTYYIGGEEVPVIYRGTRWGPSKVKNYGGMLPRNQRDTDQPIEDHFRNIGESIYVSAGVRHRDVVPYAFGRFKTQQEWENLADGSIGFIYVARADNLTGFHMSSYEQTGRIFLRTQADPNFSEIIYPGGIPNSEILGVIPIVKHNGRIIPLTRNPISLDRASEMDDHGMFRNWKDHGWENLPRQNP